ncbi:MAG: glycosyltransferase [Burkholderiaceae bacterium]|nr:glycosyltransferase [Rhodoferax sp.]MCP5284746.1 glycosyltransferase [Burkholderiaceae bacterium]
MIEPLLTIVPSVPVWVDGGRLVLDRKFHDGALQYVKAWPGRVRCLMRRASGAWSGFGAVRARPADLPYEVTLLATDAAIEAGHVRGAAVVLAAADDHHQLQVAALCRQVGARCVYVIEYIPETRHQINRLESPGLLTRLRRDHFLRRRERDRRAAFDACDGLQANGVPAHEAYAAHGNCLLYLDTRMSRRMLIDEAALEQRLQGLRTPRPLQLAFSGRLIAMKGADHLVRVAQRLQARGVRCEWTVYGQGELEPSMRRQVRDAGLESVFRMPGSVDFETDLVPAIQRGVDLYVMLHRQSDPSCTYLETLSCGIPIVGYANRALAGVLRLADVGVGVPVDDVEAVVEAVAGLDQNRARLAELSRAAARFSREHAFEDTFVRRVRHLEALLEAVP